MKLKYISTLARLLKTLRIITAIFGTALKKEPYLVITFIFISWVLFCDSADLTTQYKLQKKINKLLAEQTYYQKQIEIMQQEVISNEALLEKFAREKYLMKKPTEDIYIIIEP